MPFTKPIISIENVVATGTIDQKLDLKDITKDRNYTKPDCEIKQLHNVTWQDENILLEIRK